MNRTLCSVFWGWGLLACGHPASPPVPTLPMTVSGQAQLTGEKVQSGIKITLQGNYTNVTETDDGGNYQFQGVPAGSYSVQASYGDFTREGQVTTNVTGAAGALVMVPMLTLTPAGAISGLATLGTQQTGNGGIRVSLDGTDLLTTTDDSGAFYLARVPEGTYRIRVDKSDYGGRTLMGVVVTFGQVTMVDPLVIAFGIGPDFNHPPVFASTGILETPFQPALGSSTDPLPFDLAPGQVARYDTVKLQATASDPDGDAITYFWSVTAGTLDRTDLDTANWSVSDATAMQATISVRVVDARGAASYLSASATLVDVQSLSGNLLPDGSALYAYRPFSGTWRVLHYDFGTGALAFVGQLDSLDDPEPDQVGSYYHATPFSNGDRLQMFWLASQQPAARTPDGNDRGFSSGNHLVRTKTQSTGNTIIAYDPVADASTELFDCDGQACALETASDNVVVSLVRTAGVDAVSVYSYDFTTATKSPLALSGPVGNLVRTDGVSIVFTDVEDGFGRSSPNDILRVNLATGSAAQIYSGAYDVFVGAFDGRYVGYTEQAYRVVYSPETAFLHDSMLNSTTSFEASTNWAHDAIDALRGGRILGRRYPMDDWLKDPDRTHYQLVTRTVP